MLETAEDKTLVVCILCMPLFNSLVEVVDAAAVVCVLAAGKKHQTSPT